VVPGLLWALWNVYYTHRQPQAAPDEEELAAS
jgi:hypothetical protein